MELHRINVAKLNLLMHVLIVYRILSKKKKSHIQNASQLENIYNDREERQFKHMTIKDDDQSEQKKHAE